MAKTNFLTAAQVADMYYCDVTTVSRMVRRGDLKAERFGTGKTSPYMIREEDARRAFAKRDKKAAA